MTDEIKAARVFACCTTALIRAMGMQAENQMRQHQGYAMAYDEAAFNRIILEEGTDWNAVHKVLYQ
jgi:hypothetical protein